VDVEMEDARIPTSEQLMAEMGWVRQLARALAKDEVLADDVAQDTWLVAAERHPDATRPLRPWLGRVVINLVRTRRRGEGRRQRREAEVDGERDVPTPAELVERVQLQRAVADEVLALAEPYRSTILLHFVEEQSSAEIARRLGIPDGTVRRRLKVALDQLRDALRKRTDPPRRGWLAALVPFARSPGPTPHPAAMGVLAMKKVIGIVVLLTLLLAIGLGLLWHRRARSDGSASEGPASTAGSQRSLQGRGQQAQPAIPAWLPQAGAPPRRIAGRVVSRGTPIGGATVQLGLEVAGEPSTTQVMPDSLGFVLQSIAVVTSAPDGTFDFGVRPPAPFTVSASAAHHSPGQVRLVNADPHATSDQLVVQLGDCGSRLSGMVADASGGGIAKAHISLAGQSGTDSDTTGAYSVCLSPRDGLGTPTVEAFKLTPDLRVGGLAIVDGATFSKIGLPPGRYAVEAKAGAEVDGRSVEVRPGQAVHVTLRRRGAGTVEGTVTELAAHKPVAGMRRDANLSMGGQMSGSPPDPSRQAFTDAAGHFVVNAPVGRVRIFCFSPNGGPLSPAGADVEVTSAAPARANVFSVRATFGGSPGDAGFTVAPSLLPLTVGQVAAKGPAAATGLAAGDHLVTIDGASLQGVLPDGAMVLLMNHRPGSGVRLGIEHDGVVRTIEIAVVAGHP
jgi:RNA polymerase sigma factor (sigma-70 family)